VETLKAKDHVDNKLQMTPKLNNHMQNKHITSVYKDYKYA